jgi:DUF177 domain-containing protein
MQIELASIESGKGKFAHIYQPDQLIIEDERIQLTGPAEVSGSIKRERQMFKVEGRLKARIKIECDRCLQPIESPIESEFSLEYVTREQYESFQNAELSEEDLDVSTFDGEVIDIDEIVKEQLLLATPSQVVCQEDCKGLCSECGANLNEGDCGCQKTEIDPRWAGLKQMMNGEE